MAPLLVMENCCWCGRRNSRSTSASGQIENQVERLLRLLKLSSVIVAEDENENTDRLCSNCSDLVDSGWAYKKALEDVKSLLKRRTFSKTDKNTRESRTVIGNSAATLGQKLSKCFFNCFVQLETIDLAQFEKRGLTTAFVNGTGTTTEIMEPEIELPQVDIVLPPTEIVAQQQDAPNGSVAPQNIDVLVGNSAAADNYLSPVTTNMVEFDGEEYKQEWDVEEMEDENCDNLVDNHVTEPSIDATVDNDEITSTVAEFKEDENSDGHNNLGFPDTDGLEEQHDQETDEGSVGIDMQSDNGDSDFTVEEVQLVSESDSDDDPTFRTSRADSKPARKKSKSTGPLVLKPIAGRLTRASTRAVKPQSVAPPDGSSGTNVLQTPGNSNTARAEKRLLHDNELKCSRCSKEFSSNAKYIAHMNVHLVDERSAEIRLQRSLSETTCLLCDFTSILPPTMAVHLKIEHGIIKRTFRDNSSCYTCKQCFTPFKPSDQLQPIGHLIPDDLGRFNEFVADHADCNRGEFSDFKCPDCNHESTGLTELLKHQTEEHPTPLECRFCTEMCRGYREMQVHLKKVHDQPFAVERKCYSCWKPFDSVEKIQSHYAELGPFEPYNLKSFAGFPCLPCGLYFDSPALLTVHMQEFHDCKQELTYHCHRCRRNFNSNDSLQANPDSENSDTFLLMRNDNRLATFTTFTGKCAQHFQDCLARNMTGGNCTRDLDPKPMCYICSESIDCPQELAVHLNEHMGVKTAIKCPICTHISPDESSHRHHIVKVHRVRAFWPNVYHCDHCLEPWKSEKNNLIQGQLEENELLNFIDFVNSHEKCGRPQRKTFECRYCDDRSPTPKRLHYHEAQRHTKFTPYSCDQCGEEFYSHCGLRVHMDHFGIHQVGTGRKKTVPKLRQSVPGVVKRKRLQRLREPYKCSKCDKVLLTSAGVSSHRAVHEAQEAKEAAGPDGRFPHVCDKCGKDFPLLWNLINHKRGHEEQTQPVNEDQKVVCHVCGREFARRPFLLKHLLCMHPEEREKTSSRTLKYTPEQRRRRIREKQAKYLASKPKEHLCPYCGKAFHAEYFLDIHTNTHTGNKPFICKTCGMGFASPTALNQHEQLHNEKRERNVPCPLCDKKFFRKCNVYQHIRVFHNKVPWPSKVKTYTKWVPPNPEALAAAGIEYNGKPATDNNA